MAKAVSGGLWGLLAMVLQAIIGIVSPEIRELLTEQVQLLYQRAKDTSNPLDDVLVKALAALLQIELEE